MIKQTEKISEIVSKQFAEESLNVFFGGDVFFVYSEKYVLPVRISRRGFFRYANFPSEPVVFHDGEESLRSFLDDACRFLNDNYKIQWIAETPASALFEEAPSRSKSIPFGSHVINLEDDVEVLWGKVHSKHRNVIKKAEKEGVVVVKGQSDKILEDYHSIDVETWERSRKKANGVGHLKEMVSRMKDQVIVYIAYKDGEPQAGAVFFYNRAMCYYMYGASKNHAFSGASNYLHWTAIQDMKSASVKRYSFVGCRINEDEDSKYHGIQRFKERFGGELLVGKRFKLIFKPAIYALYKLFVDVVMSVNERRIVRHRDTIDQEWHKWN